MALPPHRIPCHLTDSKASALIPLFFSENWVLRDLTERDFGIDKIAERFENGYATSEMFMLQIKGTEEEIDSKNPRFSLKTKTLIYAEMFSVPFLLLFCSVAYPNRCYYLWLQEYIRVRLNFENPNWRNQDTNTVYFPIDNLLGNNKAEEHLSYISKFPKYQSSWVSYYLSLNDLCYDFQSAFNYDIMEKDKIKAVIQPTVSKLETAQKNLGKIPRRFVPQLFESTIELGRNMLKAEEIPPSKLLFTFIENCQIIQASVDAIALRFDASHLRLLYEYEGAADF